MGLRMQFGPFRLTYICIILQVHIWEVVELNTSFDSNMCVRIYIYIYICSEENKYSIHLLIKISLLYYIHICVTYSDFYFTQNIYMVSIVI